MSGCVTSRVDLDGHAYSVRDHSLLAGSPMRSILTILFAAALTPALAAAQSDSAARAAAVDRLFARWTSTTAPGCAVAVHEAGRPRLARAYGMADLERDVPNTPETVFEAGSVSKQFTAAA